MGKDARNTRVVTGLGRISYPVLFKPKAVGRNPKPDAEKKYSAVFIFPKSDRDTYDDLKYAFENAIDNGLDDRTFKDDKDLDFNIKDGDEKFDESGEEEYRDCWFFNAASGKKPGIVDTHGQALLEEEDVPPGCYVKMEVNLFPYAVGGNKGIAFGLNHVLYVKDGPRLGGGGSSAKAAFAKDIDDRGSRGNDRGGRSERGRDDDRSSRNDDRGSRSSRDDRGRDDDRSSRNDDRGRDDDFNSSRRTNRRDDRDDDRRNDRDDDRSRDDRGGRSSRDDRDR